MDETTSAVDAGADISLQMTLREALQDSTVIVGHQIATMAEFDVLEDGAVAELRHLETSADERKRPGS